MSEITNLISERVKQFLWQAKIVSIDHLKYLAQ